MQWCKREAKPKRTLYKSSTSSNRSHKSYVKGSGVMNSSNTSNQSDVHGTYPFIVQEHLPYAILSILIVLVNALVILLFAFKRTLRNPSNYLFVSLSFSDLLSGLVGVPLLLVCSTIPNCIPCILSFHFVRFTSISTILHILVITCERYAKIVFPLRAHRIGRMSFELRVMALLWSVSVIVPLVPFTWIPLSQAACEEDESDSLMLKNRIFNIVHMTLFVGLPLLLLLYADVSVLVVVRQQLYKIDEASVGGRDAGKLIRKQSKVIAIMAVMTVYFLLCWSFYYAAIMVQSIGEEMMVPEWLDYTVAVLRITTSLINPLLYVLLKQDFRRAFVSIVKQARIHRRHTNRNLAVRYTNESATIGQTSNSRNHTEKTAFL